MIAAVGLFLAGLVGPLGVARADDEDDKDDVQEGTVTGTRIPRAIIKPVPPEERELAYQRDVAYAKEHGLPVPEMRLPKVVLDGAVALGMDKAFVYDGYEATQAVYRRDYKEARARFDKMATVFPNQGIAPTGQVLIWQALMLENFDYRYEAQYLSATKVAHAELEQALLQAGNEGWEHFLYASVLGIDAIHAMRKAEYASAIGKGYEAMKQIEACKTAAPAFIDATLGDGLWNYWRTVISMSSKLLPDFEDKRPEGIQQMARVESGATFLGPAATFALTWTWIEEGDNDRALQAAQINHSSYPNNIVNNLVLARIYGYKRNYTAALSTLDEVLKVDPDNRLAHYNKGSTYLRMNKNDLALESLDKYLSYSDLDPESVAWAHYKKGQAFARLKRWDEAEAAYKYAWKVGKLERAKNRLDGLDNLKKRG